MTAYKAKYIGSISYETYYNQCWEYRGKQYIVTVPVGWGGSRYYYGNGYTYQKNQHKREQEAIDAQIEAEKKSVT